MKRIAITLVVFFAGWLAIWLIQTAMLPRDPETASDIYVSTGYRDTLDLYLRHDWLRYRPNSRTIEPNFPPDSPMARFYRQSFLRRDVNAFNNGNHTLFRIENNQIVDADPYAHNMTLPFYEPKHWRGNLTYRPISNTSATLRGQNMTIQLNHPTTDLSRKTDWRDLTLYDLSRRKTRQHVSGSAFNLFGEGNVYFGKIHLVGDSIIFNNRDRNNLLDVSISGEPVLKGGRARIDSGDLLKLQWQAGGRDYYSLLYATVTEDAPLIAGYRSVNGQWKHVPDRPEPHYINHLLAALDNSFRATRTPVQPESNDFDLALTLDGPLQENVQALLNEECRRLRGSNASAKGVPAFRGAVTVMDAKTGELLALASYPAPEDIETLDNTGSGRERLLRNHNFSRLSIGSVAKIIWSAAILHGQPGLADLKIREYAEGRFDNILGISINPPLSDHNVYGGPDKWVDFAEYVQQSSNRYAAILLTLATGYENGRFQTNDPSDQLNDKLPLEEEFMLGNQLYKNRPKLLLDLSNAGEDDMVRAGVTPRLEFETHAQALYNLFDIQITQMDRPREGGRGDDLLDTTLWLPLLKHLYGEDIPLNHAFYGVSPERENLAYNLIDNYRTQYLSMILGGADSTWTNVKLTEILSRLVTGQKIQPAIIHRLKTNDPQPDPEIEQEFISLDMNSEARATILDAMTLVAGPGGTAGKLYPMLRDKNKELQQKDKVLGFFSKTGSPTNISYLPSQIDRAIKSLINSRALTLGGDGRIRYRDKGTVSRVTNRGTGGYRFVEHIRNNAADRNMLRRLGINPLMVVNLCHEYNYGNRRSSPFVTNRGRLTGFRKANTVRSVGGVYAFTIGVYDKEAQKRGGNLPQIDVNNHQPERAYSVSIVIESQGSATKVAVPFAQKLIDKAIWPVLTREEQP